MIKLDPEHKKIALSVKEYLVDTNKHNSDDIVVGAAKPRSQSKKKKKPRLRKKLPQVKRTRGNND